MFAYMYVCMYICLFVCKNLIFSILGIKFHILHFITTSTLCILCYRTLTKECKKNRTAICGEVLELSEIFTVKK